jgi:hydrogenase-4 component F
MLFAYLVLGVATLAFMLVRVPDPRKRADYVNTLAILHSAAYLAVTVLAMFYLPLPSYFFTRYLVVDSLALYEVLIGCSVFLLSAFYSRGFVRGLVQSGEIEVRELRVFYAAFNLLLMAVVFAFYCNNLALFWILLELTTILSAVLIVTLNAKENIVAALKYLFTASTAMLFSIIGLILLFAMTKQATGAGLLNWDTLRAQAATLPPSLFTFSFMFVFVGFAAKAGIVPFHTWLPQAHAKAPSVISVLLSSVLLNIGIFGILKLYAIAHLNPAWHTVSIMMIAFGGLTLGVAALSMLPRGNVKKLIAFSSVEHMGFILVGIGLGTPVVLFWVLFHTLAHAMVKALLFFSAGILHQQYHSNQFEDMKDPLRLQPLATGGLILGSMAIIGMPMFPIFLSKLNILTQIAAFSLPVLLGVLIFFLIVASAFAAILTRTIPQKADREYEPYRVSLSMKVPMVLLIAGILFMGLYFPSGLRNMLTGIVGGLGF